LPLPVKKEEEKNSNKNPTFAFLLGFNEDFPSGSSLLFYNGLQQTAHVCLSIFNSPIY